MPHLPPIDAQPITGRQAERDWGALGWSLFAHLLFVVLLVVLARRDPMAPAAEPDKPGAPPTPTERVVFLTPPAVPEPLPRPPQERPPEPERLRPREMPRPQVERGVLSVPDDPANAQATTGSPEPERQPSAPAPQPPPHPTSSAETMVASAAPTLESEAMRIFGPRRAASNTGPAAAVPRTGGPTDDRANDCTPVLRPPRAPGARIELEYVEGTVFYDASRRVPLPGAHLQISGTGYGTFADDRGHYRLGFDPALIDDCRSQYVRVLAPGVPPQLIVLGRGPGGTDIFVRR